ncbi:hypothetical protein BDZ89DRAFT_1135941 [Hymenopellis radicata]|nr:hypothetical protein BDZ89DRAFT_1135941 [Hymenopellis radicata]
MTSPTVADMELYDSDSDIDMDSPDDHVHLPSLPVELDAVTSSKRPQWQRAKFPLISKAVRPWIDKVLYHTVILFDRSILLPWLHQKQRRL